MNAALRLPDFDDPRTRRFVWIAGGVLLFLLTVAALWWYNWWGRALPDVTAYWRAAVNLRGGESIYAPPPPGPSPKAFLYPPFFAVVFSSLTFLATPDAYAVWMALHFVFLFLLLSACARLAGLEDHASRARYLALCLAWIPAAVGHDFNEGQVNLFVLGLAVVGLDWIERGRTALGATTLAMAVHLKLLPVVLFGSLLLQRRYRAVAIGAAAGIALVLAPAIVTVPREGLVAGVGHAITMHVDFVRHILAPGATDATVAGSEQFYVLNNSLTAVFHRLFGKDVLFSPFPSLANWHGPLVFPLPRPLIRTLAAAGGITLLGAAMFFAWRNATTRIGRATAYGLAYAAIELATLNCWEHHLVFVALMLAPIAATERGFGSRELALLTVATFVLWTALYLLYCVTSPFDVRFFTSWIIWSRKWGIPTLAIVTLFALAWRDLRET